MVQHTEHRDGAERAARAARLRRVFAALMHRRELDVKACQWLIDAVDRQHARNIAAFGWTDAEAMRAMAFADVASASVPIGDATESDLAALREAA
jgi:predicted nucleotidyltransferase